MSSALFDLEAAESLWQDYAAAHPERARDSEPPVVDRFGGGGELTDRLLALVLDGPKRATATLVPEFEAEGQALPRGLARRGVAPQRSHARIRACTQYPCAVCPQSHNGPA